MAVLLCWGSIVLQNPVLNAQDVDACPDGWEEAARSYLTAHLDGKFERAASFVVEDERQAWLEWQEWRQEKLERTWAGMAPELLERQAEEKESKRNRLMVSHCLCERRTGDGDGAYRIRIDPDGRSFRILNMRHGDDGGWAVETRHVMLDGERAAMAKAFMRAVDERRWEEAEVWVATSAKPRFKGYQLEVEAYLNGSELIGEANRKQSALRVEEWPDAMLWAVREDDGVVVVHAEFRTAMTLSCELVEVGDSWRVLMR